MFVKRRETQTLLAVSRSSFFGLINPFPNDKILGWSKFKTFADERVKWDEKQTLVWRGIKNIVGKGENAGYQHFLLFPQYF